RTIHAHRFRPKMVGGGMIGPQNTAVKTTLGPLLNGFVNCEILATSSKDDGICLPREISAESLSGIAY
ncbi:MAG TPA: hypothetical protein VLQ80_18650, partial [Candidatus Saccharimonadia bacterium]|nr:hypothetical protein [Candidatus Saccharimonadia bacterium]